MTSVRRIGQALRTGLAGLAALALLSGGAGAAESAHTAGKFDFYVLALSWSPSWCASGGDRAETSVQCSGPKPFGFVVHGLWPQYERGFPESCAVSVPGPGRGEVDAMLDLMPSPGLVRHQWRKHGTCSGLAASDFFKAVRTAAGRVTIPPAFTSPQAAAMVSPDAVEAAFIAANPGLPADAIAVTCDKRRLREVRVCLDRDLKGFRACGEVDRRSCRAPSVQMPAVRAGATP